MVIHTMYRRKIKHYNRIFNDTVRLYRGAVDYLISVCMDHWTEVAAIPKELERKTYVESMIHRTKDNPVVPYGFDDLNASYNIGARYFIRELLKTVPVTEQQGILAKVPGCSKRSTCTLSDLISLNAVLCA